MIKVVAQHVWVYDAEWVPDPVTIRAVYGCPLEWSDAEVLEHAYKQAGATTENPRPFLKTILCRIVSIAAVKRMEQRGECVSLELVSVPKLGEGFVNEGTVIDRFLESVGRVKPQLVGFNNVNADLPAILQRALVNRVSAPKFCTRPMKSWEGVDYFGKYSDWHIDLLNEVGSFGKGTNPTLHQIAAACGIPAKHGGSGSDVAELWNAGKLAEIIRYNQRDCLTTYLVWLRLAYLAGKVTSSQLDAEEALLVQALLKMIEADRTRLDLVSFVEEWRGQLAELEALLPQDTPALAGAVA